MWHDPNVQIPKPSEADKERFRSLVPDAPGVEVKPMFGNLGAFVNGNMFMGLFGADVGVKLGESDLVALKAAGGAGFGPAERPMGGYLTLPAGLDDTSARDWAEKALANSAALPPKAPKPKKK